MRSEVTEGQTITISCTVESFPQSTLTLMRINTNNLYSRPINSLSYKFTVTSVDAGLYFCRAQNTEGSKDSKQKELVVKYSPNNVKVQANPGLDVKENVSLTLSCSAESNPPVSSVTWRKTTDGREEIIQQTQTQTFRVNSASPSDSGLYSCEATNDIGRGMSQPAEVKVRYKPRKTSISVSGSSDNQVKVGRSLTLTCDTDANPAPTTYSWYRSKNQQTDSLWKNTNRRELSLRIQRADEACYSCRASNLIGGGDKSQPVCIQVLYPPTEPKLSIRSEVTEGQTITISCTVESFPQSTLTLMRTNTYQSFIIAENNLNSRPINSLYHTLTVTSADAGWYFCRAQNTEGSKDSKQKKLVVKYSPKHVTVQANPGLEVKENVLLTLSCSAESNPPVSSVTWRKTTDGREEIIQQTQTQTFRVNSASPSDSGLYSCEATNDIGRGKSQPAEVKVRYKPRKTSISVSGSSDNQVKVGRSLTLTCDTDANPAPTTYSWYRSKNQQTDSWWKNTNRRELSLRIQREDEACYSCSSSNLIGRGGESQPVCIQVLYSPKHVTVQAIPGLDVKENMSLTLSCSAESNPPVSSVTWRKMTDGREEIIRQTQTQTFRVNSASPSDSGLYSCEATNDIGSGKSQPAEVKVRYPPTEPKLSMRSEVTEGQTITVTCTVESFPQSTLTLIKTNKNLQSLKITENNLYSRPINSLYHTFNVTSSDAGLYVCRAQNTVGSKDSKKEKLVVKYSPKHVTVQANPRLDVKENVSLTLSCSAESNPPVSSVTWRKTTDGREEIIQQTQTQTFRVNSASPSDSGLYSCEATNDIGSGKSQPAEVKVRFSPKHTNITESAEKQELDGRSSVMLSCFSHSFPPVQHYSWYRKSQGEEKDKLVSEHQNHTVYSNQRGFYYCVAKNEEGQRLSDPVHLFERNSLHILKFLVPALVVLMIIILIIVVLRFRRKKSVQQGTTNRTSLFLGWCNGTRRRSLTYENVSAEPFRSRDDLLSEQLRRQPLPDSTPPTNTNVVYSLLNLPQAASAQNPKRQKAGNTEDDSVNYTSLHFKNNLKNKPRKVEDDSVYAVVSKPTRVKKNEPESLPDYENLGNAAARAPTSLSLFDDYTSEGEVELDYSQVSFTATPRRQATNRDSSSSEEETSYSDVRI
ncbi:B-cell receptor CD22-like [Platichthys flesus]|uniref:B-cell receptor CD22-like n=1 Tax=Platichthys flesus TaxID=8260 RepID=UPI002DB779C3|nr:B-cell receptor CD22-like [Platichthys flesus]